MQTVNDESNSVKSKYVKFTQEETLEMLEDCTKASYDKGYFYGYNAGSRDGYSTGFSVGMEKQRQDLI